MPQDADTTGDVPADTAKQQEQASTASSHQPHTHIALADGTTTAPGMSTPADGQEGDGPSDTPAASPGMRNSRGWDGKLRLPRRGSASVSMADPGMESDPESDDGDIVVPGEVLPADEDLLNDEDPDTDEIILTHARIHDIEALGLERFKCLQRLCLRQNGIQSLSSGLGALADSLQELDMYDNLVTHMRGVECLPNLTSLDLSFNKIKHVKHIEGLPKLVDLYLVANKISSVEGLEGLAAAATLRMLELGSNRLRSIAPLGGYGFVALEELWLAKNKITSLDGIQGLPKLRLLSVQSNRLRDLAPLRDVPTLEELYVSHNALASLESLRPPPAKAEDAPKDASAGDDASEEDAKPAESAESAKPAEPAKPAAAVLPLLRVLDIGNNQLTSLAGTEHLTQLEEVWASYNMIADFADVERCLRDKKNLETVYFEGNPLQLRGPALYRNKVRLAVPQVKQIDATYVHD